MKAYAALLALFLAAGCGSLPGPAKTAITVICPADALAQVKLAAKEVRRYVYLRTGELVTLLADMYGYLLATLHNASELGTLCNIEQQSMLRTKLITLHDPKLQQLLGEPLPADTQTWQDYRGPARLVVLTARGSLQAGESLPLRIIALDRQAMKSIVVHLRPLGKGEWKTIPATHLARAVWNATLPAAADDLEYHVVAESGKGAKLTWPATAPELSQTVVIQE